MLPKEFSNDGSMLRAVESLEANQAWRRLEGWLDDELGKSEADLEFPGEFEHGRAVGKRFIINFVREFPTWAIENRPGSGVVEIGRRKV